MFAQNKQRIVGIIVLVIFVALLIPFLLAGNSSQSQHETEANNTSVPVNVGQNNEPQVAAEDQSLLEPMTNPGPELAQAGVENKSATIPSIEQQPASQEVMPNATSQMPTAPQQPAINATNESVAIPANNTATADVSNLSNEVINAPQPAVVKMPAESSNEMSQPQALPEGIVAAPRPVTIKLPSLTEKKPVIHAKKMAKAKTKAQVKARGNWVVQVGSFADAKHVYKLEAKLRAKGFKVYTNKINTYKGELTRVSVGSGLSKQQADNIAARLEASGISAKVSRDRI